MDRLEHLIHDTLEIHSADAPEAADLLSRHRGSGDDLRSEVAPVSAGTSQGGPQLLPPSGPIRGRGRMRTVVEPVLAALVVAACLGVTYFGFHHGGRVAGPGSASLGCEAQAFSLTVSKPVVSTLGAVTRVSGSYSGDAPCVIDGGGPNVELVSPSGAVLLEGGQTNLAAAGDQTLQPGDQFSFQVNWSSWCGQRYTGAAMRFELRRSDPAWWITAHGTLTTADAPRQCQGNMSAIETWG